LGSDLINLTHKVNAYTENANGPKTEPCGTHHSWCM